MTFTPLLSVTKSYNLGPLPFPGLLEEAGSIGLLFCLRLGPKFGSLFFLPFLFGLFLGLLFLLGWSDRSRGRRSGGNGTRWNTGWTAQFPNQPKGATATTSPHDQESEKRFQAGSLAEFRHFEFFPASLAMGNGPMGLVLEVVFLPTVRAFGGKGRLAGFGFSGRSRNANGRLEQLREQTFPTGRLPRKWDSNFAGDLTLKVGNPSGLAQPALAKSKGHVSPLRNVSRTVQQFTGGDYQMREDGMQEKFSIGGEF